MFKMEKAVLLYYYALGFTYVYLAYDGLTLRARAQQDSDVRVKFCMKYWYLFFTIWNAVSNHTPPQPHTF